jgi:hypothetical protein
MGSKPIFEPTTKVAENAIFSNVEGQSQNEVTRQDASGL